ncbi:MAG TPA: glycosyltransferase [Bryobacteraceae bacterium]
MQPVVYADFRCLQDPRYRVRGIGRHVAALFRTRRKSAFSTWKVVALTDPESPKLPPDIASLADEITCSTNPCIDSAPSVFIDGTPMTHDTRFSLRFLNHPHFFRAAVLHDFIPLDWPGYLPTLGHRTDYLAKLARLRKFDRFFPVSEYTAWRASELLGASRRQMTVTGSSVRSSLYKLRDRLELASDPCAQSEPYFVIVVATDVRKNPEVAIKAMRHLNLLYGRRIPLKVVGHYDHDYKNKLLQLAGSSKRSSFLEFHHNVSDRDLVKLYQGAIATVVPSHIEGFSLPVVEASVCGCPVVASTCAAHMELIDLEEALFASDDAAALCAKLEALLNNPVLRDSLRASQASLAQRFHQNGVGERFWTALETAIKHRHGPVVITKPQKPRLAFLSPYPPDESGVARYTAMTIRAGEHLFQSDLYTDAPRPLTFDGTFRDAGPVNLTPSLNSRYDGIVSVIGNSLCHANIFKVFERCGGPCILHDARLTQIYHLRLGEEGFLRFAARLLGRPVSVEEAYNWLQDRNPATLFLEPIIERASPLIVHTVTQQAEIEKRYGISPTVLPGCPNSYFAFDELTGSRKQAVREQHGIPPGAFLISSFGRVDPVKGMETCILALELLRSWKIPAELYFVGSAHVYSSEIDRIASLYDVASHVHAQTGFIDEDTYRDFVIASDAAIQLRTYGFGQFSASLADCISAAVPTIATSDLATSCDAPSYVKSVPDRFSPLQVAEQLALISEDQAARSSHEDARIAYLETHNFEYYGKRLIEVLGVG